MSYILAAIEDAERSRELGATPRLSPRHDGVPPAPGSRRRWALVLMLLLNAALMATVALSVAPWRGHDDGAAGGGAPAAVSLAPAPPLPPAAEAPTPPPAAIVAAPLPPAALPPPPPVEIDLAPARPRASPPPRVAAEVEMPERAGVTVSEFDRVARALREEARALAAQQRAPDRERGGRDAARAPAAGAPPAAARQDAPPPVAVSAAPAAVPHVRELPAELQAQLPAISLAMHLYAREPAARKVGVGGNLVHEGETVAGELVVERISRDGVVFRYRDQPFFLGTFDEWRGRGGR